MTIKEFSKLCGCNPQTLRYYDRENLLKPVKVDEWSGYRFYGEEQAIVFVKIKNLQKAGFSIEEIRGLLNKDDTEIYYAFETKIAEEEKRLQEIKNIQKTYQTEITNMKNRIETLHKSIKESMEAYSPVEEFGIEHKDYNEIVKNVDDFFGRMLETEDLSKYELTDYSDENRKKEEQNFYECLANPNLEIVLEKHGWKNVKDFYDEIPELAEGKEYFFLFKLEKEKVENTAFANTLLGILCLKNPDRKMSLKCNVIYSDDGDNHFWLLKSGNE
ncbi:MAG: MerR family transcriptional regulator [Roseburia sp.]|nr:MerR family transcriptional regulator [Roseburia sp.]